jgi:hypothetical protein
MSFKGNIWNRKYKSSYRFLFFDERADDKQHEALSMIFTGEAGGFMSEVVKFIGEMRGMDQIPIKFEISDDLSH